MNETRMLIPYVHEFSHDIHIRLTQNNISNVFRARLTDWTVAVGTAVGCDWRLHMCSAVLFYRFFTGSLCLAGTADIEMTVGCVFCVCGYPRGVCFTNINKPVQNINNRMRRAWPIDPVSDHVYNHVVPFRALTVSMFPFKPWLLSRCPVSDNKPSSLCPVSDSKPSSLCPVSDSKPSSLCPVSDSKPSLLCPVSDSKPSASSLCPVSDGKPSSLCPGGPVASNPEVQGSNPWGTGRWGLAASPSPWLWRWAIPPASGPYTYHAIPWHQANSIKYSWSAWKYTKQKIIVSRFRPKTNIIPSRFRP